MKRLTSFLLLPVLLLLASITLIACGAPQPQPEPTPDFKVTGVSPMVAKRGQVITITGTGLGSTAGVVTVGGNAAEIVSWSETEVQAAVATDAPHAWQELSVENAAAESTTIPRFFVGVEYAGPADGLTAFVASVDADSALLLAAGTYEVPASAPDLDFRRNSLYGVGKLETVIRTSGQLRWIAASGQGVVIADLTIEADGLAVSNAGSPVAITYPQPNPPRLLTIRDAELVVGSWLRLRADELNAGVLLENITLNAPLASFSVDARHGVEINGSNLTVADADIKASEGVITLDGNVLTASVNLSVLAERMQSSVGRIANNEVYVTGDDGPTLDIDLRGGTCEVTNNVFEVVDANLDSGVGFQVDCGITPGEELQVFTRNTVKVLGDGSGAPEPPRVWFSGGMVDFADNDITTDHGFVITPWSTKGGSIRGNNFNLGAEGLMIWGNTRSVINMDGDNRVSTTGLLSSYSYGLFASIGSLTISGDNRFINDGPTVGTALRLLSSQHDTVTIRLTGAVFEGFENAFQLDHPAAYQGFDVIANGNHFDFPITSAPQVAQLSGILATDEINFDDNKWGDSSDATTVRSYISPAANPVVLTTVRNAWP